MSRLVHIPTHLELIRSCHILFGLEVKATASFFNYLQLSGVKSAFRKKAFATHPDIAAPAMNEDAANACHSFQEVKEAYDLLTGYIHRREKSSRLHTPGNRRRFSRNGHKPFQGGNQTSFTGFAGHGKVISPGSAYHQNRTTRSFFQGALPPYPLLFGRFLYYSGIISWFNISQAMVWQKTQRPLVGELGRKMGWLTMLETMQILKNSKKNQFGHAAVEMGFLTELQIRSILMKQKQLHKKIGSFFLGNNILTQEELNFLVVQQRLHNARYSANGTYCIKQK